MNSVYDPPVIVWLRTMMFVALAGIGAACQTVDSHDDAVEPRVERLSPGVYRAFSQDGMSLPIHDIEGAYDIRPRGGPQIRLVVEDRLPGPTDFGPSKRAWLVVIGAYGIPSFWTVVPVGVWGALEDARWESTSVLRLSGRAYEIGKSEYASSNSAQVTVSIDLSAILTKMAELLDLTASSNMDDWPEGFISSYVDISARGERLVQDRWP